MKYTEEQIQAAIDAAFPSQTTKATLFTSSKIWPETFKSEASQRLAIAKAFLEKLEPDPYADLKKAHAEGKVIEHRNMGDTWTTCALPSWTFSPDFYRIKPEPETFEAHGKTWTRHTPGDAMPCDRKAQVEVIYGADNRWLSKQSAQWWNWISGTITGWRHADEPMLTKPISSTPWTPAVGDVVQLKSGGPKMTIFEIKPDEVWCAYFDGKIIEHAFPQACLTPVTE